MGLVNLPPSRRSGGSSGRPWTLLDLFSFTLVAAVFIFILLVFTSLGDPLAAAGRRALARSSASDPRLRQRILAVFDLPANYRGRQNLVESMEPVLRACSAEEVDNMPCEDPRRSSQLSRKMNFYRERQCPPPGEAPLCLVPPPDGYRLPVPWPESLHKIWHANMPYDKLAERKGHQGWMKEKGPYFIFPGGGTMFPDGAVQYIEKLGQFIPIHNGLLRTALDMGCGVASFGGFLLKENVTTLSFAPRDSHKAQIQFALERGIPAFVAMLGTRRLPFPAFSFDLIHCSRCLIPFTAYNGTYFIEVDRLLRPGGYLVISGPPVQWPNLEKEWSDLQSLAHALCYELIAVDNNTVIWKKPTESSCFPNQNEFGLDLCSEIDDPSDAWYVKLKNCVSRVLLEGETSLWSIPKWPERISKPPNRLSLIKNGNDIFEADTRRWARRVDYYKKTLGLKLGNPEIRNVMDMNALFGGFAAALLSDPVWVMNVVPARKPLTLGIIYDRGLIGVYHDWCEAFSTYPRTYDLIHVMGFTSLVRDPTSGKSRCHLVDLMVEMDRILRPEGKAVMRDSSEAIEKAARIALAIRWTVRVHDSEPESNAGEKILVATKTFWRLPSFSN
ncbi:probable methyltransferase PMT13 [Phalaenopsis equestris]|uniref:probable methyltransferase PMT13 n=1 Tax=Phalaenopsis equestris TaxID=78828 RepID=UPI0009E63F65|nr:probable methyltransferase PMT13 [Phalaenopsis equestris]